MASYNRIVMIGNLTRDPEYKSLTSGQPLCKLSLASNRQFKNRQTGSMVQEVCYIDIDVWGAQAESCRQYLAKGRPVLVEGRLKLDSWDDQSGVKRSKHSIVADRIVFLSAGAQSEAGLEAEAESEPQASLHVDEAMAKNLMGQLDQVKKRAAKPAGAVKAPTKTKASDDSTEIDFKDEPPFQDDLPF